MKMFLKYILVVFLRIISAIIYIVLIPLLPVQLLSIGIRWIFTGNGDIGLPWTDRVIDTIEDKIIYKLQQ